MNVSQNSSSFTCYGKTYLDSSKGKIKVQPTAVFSRKKSKTGSRQQHNTSGKRKLELPNRRVTLKKEHNFAKIVKINKTSAKKLVAQCHRQKHILPERKMFYQLL